MEQSAVVWHSSLTSENRKDLERVQKAAVIMGSNYTTYKEGLQNLKIQTLDDRREALCLSFAKKCLKNEKVKGMFPLKHSMHNMKLRITNKFKTK